MDGESGGLGNVFQGLNLGEVLNYGIKRWVDQETGQINPNNLYPNVAPDGRVLSPGGGMAAPQTKTNWAPFIIGGAALVAVVLMLKD